MAPTPFLTIIPQDVDLAELQAGLADDGVVAPAEMTPAIVAAVSQARAEGYDVHFVVTDTIYPKITYYRDIATELQSETGGTVIVLGGNYVGSSSDEFSRVELENATDNLAIANPPQAAQQMVDRLTGQSDVPWTLVTIALIAVVAVGAVIARKLQLRKGTGAAAVDGTAESVASRPGGSESPDPL